MGGATGYLGDLVALKTVNQGWFPVDCGGTVTLLPMVIVTPGIHLKPGKIFLFSFHLLSSIFPVC